MKKKNLGCDIGGARESGVIYFPTNWGTNWAPESSTLVLQIPCGEGV